MRINILVKQTNMFSAELSYVWDFNFMHIVIFSATPYTTLQMLTSSPVKHIFLSYNHRQLMYLHFFPYLFPSLQWSIFTKVNCISCFRDYLHVLISGGGCPLYNWPWYSNFVIVTGLCMISNCKSVAKSSWTHWPVTSEINRNGHSETLQSAGATYHYFYVKLQHHE